MVNILTKAFQPEELRVIDESHKHVGHAGHTGEGESHFLVQIVSEKFAGKTRLEMHKMVYSSLNDIVPRIHALQIQAKSGQKNQN